MDARTLLGCSRGVRVQIQSRILMDASDAPLKELREERRERCLLGGSYKVSS
jgi:hypothetical protein